MTEREEQVRLREYLREKGDALPLPEVRARVAASFQAMEALLAPVSQAAATARPGPGEWSIQEVVVHLLLTHAPSLGELRDLLANRRPAGPPIPAGLQSADPFATPWADARTALAAQHAEILRALDGARDAPTAARAPVIAVINVREADGRQAPFHWMEEIAWKAYAVFAFRLHTLDHITQVKKLLGAARARA
jgi:DinB superfamily